MKLQKLAPVACLALGSLLTSNVNAATISFSAVDDVFFSFTGLNAPDFDLAPSQPPFSASFGLSSLSQFDSSLGTLTGASIHIEGNLEINAFLSDDGEAIVEADPHSIAANYSISIAGQTLQGASSCSAGGFSDPCMDDDTSNAFINTTEVFGDLSGFAGSGGLSAFGIDLLLTLDGFSFDNAEFPFIEFEIDFDQTIVTVEYEFSPVPVPAAAWLFGSGLIGLAASAMRRRVAS